MPSEFQPMTQDERQEHPAFQSLRRAIRHQLGDLAGFPVSPDAGLVASYEEGWRFEIGFWRGIPFRAGRAMTRAILAIPEAERTPAAARACWHRWLDDNAGRLAARLLTDELADAWLDHVTAAYLARLPTSAGARMN
ncbi:hypothetical protein [Antarcticirhabdus aurantiaca]|uniref:hypothetical protein n=1 Tax=Antarcticirhabdus aurantiaca TaxID=2606717 RepID=UPI00131C60C8|nr:hypothetical protein [Antarcticirhabdus aurantiaca]